MKKLYGFYADFGRMGNLDGIFIAESDDLDAIMGKDIYFGEILGKHSDIILTLEKSCIE
tara:strand:+ start:3846 stop:4022 length:177 start_codon:yes stop_codon:yes gene_type:complete